MILKIVFPLLVLFPLLAPAQAETTNALVKKVDGNALNLYFYKSTLKMLNQRDDKAFDELIKNIEKLRFMMIDKNKNNFQPSDFKKLREDYLKESFEEIMTTRMDGRNFDILLKDKKGSSLGTVILVNDSTNLYVMDMIGTVDLKKATSLFSTLDQSTDIGNKIKSFLNKDEKKKRKEDLKVEVE